MTPGSLLRFAQALLERIGAIRVRSDAEVLEHQIAAQEPLGGDEFGDALLIDAGGNERSLDEAIAGIAARLACPG